MKQEALNLTSHQITLVRDVKYSLKDILELLQGSFDKEFYDHPPKQMLLESCHIMRAMGHLHACIEGLKEVVK